MSLESFDPNCPGCRPALIDLNTGKALSAQSPVMIRINAYWETTTLEQRAAFHRVCCLNSRSPDDLRIMAQLQKGVQTAISLADN